LDPASGTAAMLQLFNAPLAYTGPALMHASTVPMRSPTPLMKGKAKTRKERKAQYEESYVSGAELPETLSGVVLPTIPPPAGQTAAERWEAASQTLATATALAETTAASAAAAEVEAAQAQETFEAALFALEAAKARSAGSKWNPKGLDVSWMPGPLKGQFVEQYVSAAPTYLDGSMAGDVGFDPWGLVALAAPTAATDKFARSSSDRDAKMLSMPREEQREALEWMRESELKHARLAMLAAAGWPLAELNSGGRAPSLFNGHLLEYTPFLLIAFAPFAYLEFQNKDRLLGGDYGFDPLGLAPFAPPLGNSEDPEAMKLAEVKNGRLAMMAITGMAVQEFVWGTPVVEQTPFFFGR